MPSAAKLDKKEAYHTKLCEYLEKYDKAFLFGADNVGSKQFMDIRKALRPNSVLLMGKNTMMKRSIRLYCETTGNDKWAVLLEALVGNVGLVFTTSDFIEVRQEIAKYKVGAPARFGLLASEDVHIKSGTTGMDPSQTSFFQALNIATKINKGTIEIVNDVHLIKAGERVSASAATLLAKLGIKPFKYGLQLLQVFEGGALFDTAVLDITDEMLLEKVQAGIQMVASICLAANYPTIASIPHSVVNGYKRVLAVSLATEYTFPLSQKVKDILADPSKFITAAPVAEEKGPAVKEEKKAEPESESEEDMGFSLFD